MSGGEAVIQFLVAWFFIFLISIIFEVTGLQITSDFFIGMGIVLLPFLLLIVVGIFRERNLYKDPRWENGVLRNDYTIEEWGEKKEEKKNLCNRCQDSHKTK